MDAEGLHGVVRAARDRSGRARPGPRPRPDRPVSRADGHPDGQARRSSASMRRSRRHPVLAGLAGVPRATSTRNGRGGQRRPRRARAGPGRSPGAGPAPRSGPPRGPAAASGSGRPRRRNGGQLRSHLGKHPRVPRPSHRDEGHPDRAAGPTGPGALQLGEGRAAGDASDRPWGHGEASDGETVAPLEPPRLQDGPPRPGGHALAEPVGAGPFPGVGLVGALHVNSAFRDAVSRRRNVGTGSSQGPCLGLRVEFRPPAASPPMLGAICRWPLVAPPGTVYVHPITHTEDRSEPWLDAEGEKGRSADRGDPGMEISGRGAPGPCATRSPRARGSSGCRGSSRWASPTACSSLSVPNAAHPGAGRVALPADDRGHPGQRGGRPRPGTPRGARAGSGRRAESGGCARPT